MSEESPQSRPQSALQVFWRGFLRLLLILLIGAIVVAVVVWGWPYVYSLIAQPVQDVAGRIAGVETSLDQSRADAAALAQRLEKIETAFEDDRSQSATQVAGLESRATGLEAALAEQQAALARLEDLETSLASLEDELQTQKSTAEEQQAALDELVNGPDSLLATTQREVQVLKAMQLLNRARLFLLQSNFGLAREDVSSARDLLDDAAGSAPDEEHDRLAAWVARIDLVLAALPDFPIQAADDLETAWRMISADVAVLPTAQAPAPTLSSTVTPTAAQTGTPTSTPTAAQTGTPTATPILTKTATRTPASP